MGVLTPLSASGSRGAGSSQPCPSPLWQSHLWGLFKRGLPVLLGMGLFGAWHKMEGFSAFICSVAFLYIVLVVWGFVSSL